MQIWVSTTKYSKSSIAQFENKLYQSLIDNNTGNIPDAVGSTSWVLYADPISQVYTALWTMLEANARLADMVKVGNRIKYSGTNRDPEKKEVLDSDMPELQLVSVGSTPGVGATSNGTKLVKRFRVQVSTGDLRVDAGLYAIEWEVLRAFANWADTLRSLTWNGKNYVIKAIAASVQDGKSNNELQRGIRGWISIWECEVEMWFTTVDMTTVA